MKSQSLLQKYLPCLGLYNSNCHSSSGNWLCYKISTNEVRLLQYDQSLILKQNFSIFTNGQPIKQIKIIFDSRENQLYLAIVYLTRYVLYIKDKQIQTIRLKLDRNIVNFVDNFVACDAKDDGNQVYFTFITSTALIHIVPIANPQKKTILKFNLDNRACKIKILSTNVVVGDQNGVVYLLDLNNFLVLKQFQTKSNLPILHIQVLCSRILIPTCLGQLFSLSQSLSQSCSISCHQSMITKIHTDKQKLYTFGDDCVLNIFSINKNNQIQLVGSKSYNQRINMFVNLNKQSFMNFYQELGLQDIPKQ